MQSRQDTQDQVIVNLIEVQPLAKNAVWREVVPNTLIEFGCEEARYPANPGVRWL